MLVAGGCHSTPEEPPAEPRASEQDVLPQYETARTQMRVEEGLDRIPPTLVMGADDMTLVFQLPSPARIEVRRVEGQGGVAVASAEGERGQMVVVDRREGVRLGGRALRNGPLQRRVVYELYVLPPGGVRQEVTRTTVRPPTPEEIEAAREARLEREAAERGATQEPPPEEAPTTGPSP